MQLNKIKYENIVLSLVLLKALPPVCMKYTAEVRVKTLMNGVHTNFDEQNFDK